MSTPNVTRADQTVNREFVRRGAAGFELVKQIFGLTLLIPVKPAVTRIETGILVGHELDTSRSILINLPSGQVQVLEVL